MEKTLLSPEEAAAVNEKRSEDEKLTKAEFFNKYASGIEEIVLQHVKFIDVPLGPKIPQQYWWYVEEELEKLGFTCSESRINDKVRHGIYVDRIRWDKKYPSPKTSEYFSPDFNAKALRRALSKEMAPLMNILFTRFNTKASRAPLPNLRFNLDIYSEPSPRIQKICVERLKAEALQKGWACTRDEDHWLSFIKKGGRTEREEEVCMMCCGCVAILLCVILFAFIVSIMYKRILPMFLEDDWTFKTQHWIDTSNILLSTLPKVQFSWLPMLLGVGSLWLVRKYHLPEFESVFELTIYFMISWNLLIAPLMGWSRDFFVDPKWTSEYFK